MVEANGTSGSQQPVRHILSLSGGKDSTALAIFMRDKVSEMEYIFCDTGEELPETYEYLDKLEVFLGKPINRLNPERPFSHYLKLYKGVLPDARTRWCTRKLKIEPFERFVEDDLCYSYVGIRADEPHRKGYISTKPNIIPQYPFIDAGIVKDDVFKILEESGLGIPKYYDWRSRSGCYFCFFQQRIEWVGLLEQHADLFQKASQFEQDKENVETGERYTWSDKESLIELMRPERIEEIRQEHRRRQEEAQRKRRHAQSLDQVFGFSSSSDEDGDSCLICHL
jgi:3'-phosphoadenosine 5'-phosphosulfate sulfotransferase (PAPS reductase)/FAD synthetase